MSAYKCQAAIEEATRDLEDLDLKAREQKHVIDGLLLRLERIWLENRGREMSMREAADLLCETSRVVGLVADAQEHLVDIEGSIAAVEERLEELEEQMRRWAAENSAWLVMKTSVHMVFVGGADGVESPYGGSGLIDHVPDADEARKWANAQPPAEEIARLWQPNHTPGGADSEMTETGGWRRLVWLKGAQAPSLQS